MKITRELFDNGKQIVHVNYEKKDIEKIRKEMEERKLHDSKSPSNE